MTAKDLLSSIGNDEHKINLLSKIIDELLEECDEPEKYKYFAILNTFFQKF